MPIPFIDLSAQQERIRKNIEARITAVLDHGKYIMGPEISELEAGLTEFCGAKHSITCGSGTDALLLPLMAWNIQKGDAVFIPSFTFFATAEVVSLLGATPIFVDIDPTTFNIDPNKLENAIKAVINQDETIHPLPSIVKKQRLIPKAIIAVDLFGLPADYSSILSLAKKYNLKVLEDSAQGFGGEAHGKKACNMGCHAATTSFFPAKPLGCYGDGGCVFTNDDDLADVIKSLRVHGKGSDKYDNIRIGLNARMDTLQAAILLPKLDIFGDELKKRQRVADWYETTLANSTNIVTPKLPTGHKSAWAQYTVLCKNGEHRSAVRARLHELGIPTMIYYVTPLPFLDVYKDLGYTTGNFVISEEYAERVLSLPMHPYLTKKDFGDAGLEGLF